MSISVIFVIKNGVTQGYCFWDSLLSSLPFANEIIISDGYSGDGTFDYLIKFRERYGNQVPIHIYQEQWPDQSFHGEAIAEMSNRMIAKASGDWFYYLQADEILHEDNIPFIQDISSSDYNSACFGFHHFLHGWTPSSEGGYTEAVRMARTDKGILLVGDGWTLDKNFAEPICPASYFPKKIYHFASVFK
jgi:hypothetical protein